MAAILTGTLGALALLARSDVAAALAVVGLVTLLVSFERPNRWSPRNGDLATVPLSGEDLDQCLAAARGRRGRGDRDVTLNSVNFLVSDDADNGNRIAKVSVVVRVRRGDGEEHDVVFDRPPRRVTFGEREVPGAGPVGPAGPGEPWRVDPTWDQLLALSWRRMQPFSGSVTLRPVGDCSPGRACWEVIYWGEPIAEDRPVSFRRRSTGIYRLGRAAGSSPKPAERTHQGG